MKRQRWFILLSRNVATSFFFFFLRIIYCKVQLGCVGTPCVSKNKEASFQHCIQYNVKGQFSVELSKKSPDICIQEVNEISKKFADVLPNDIWRECSVKGMSRKFDEWSQLLIF